MIDTTKLTKFVQRLDGLIALLDRKKEPSVLQRVNRPYYIQKREELKLLLQQLEETEDGKEEIANRINEEYSLVFQKWQEDIKWLNSYRQKQHKRPVL